MNDKIQRLYDKVYDELEQYVKKNSMYNPSIFKTEPNEKLFPIIIVKELPRTSIYNDLSYKDELYYYSMEINIYAMQKGNIAGSTITAEIATIIERFFKDVYRMNVKVFRDAPNVDTSVHRNIITVKCIIDTKYKDKLILYPK